MYAVNNPLSRLSYAQVFLMVSDSVGIILSFYASLHLRHGRANFDFLYSLSFAGFLATIAFVFFLFDLYKKSRSLFGLHYYGRPFVAVAALIPATALYLFAYPPTEGSLFGRGILGLFFAAFYLWVFCSRFLARIIFHRPSEPSDWLILGQSSQFQSILAEIKEEGRHYGMSFSPAEGSAPEALGLQKWSGVIVCDESSLSQEAMRSIMDYRLSGKKVYRLGDFYETLWPRVSLACLKDGWFTFSGGFSLLHNRLAVKLKRICDILLSSFLLVVTLPISLLVALAIKLDSSGPALYVQERTGLGGKPFTIFKFRSMKRDAEKDGAAWTVKKDKRITRVGQVIRLMRLDELPQLINIFKGDMSFIGPRPESLELAQLYEREIPFYNTRHTVKPGLSGWAQVLYPYGSSVEDAWEKLQYDLYYIKNFSFFLDLIIFLKTFRVVLFGRGR